MSCSAIVATSSLASANVEIGGLAGVHVFNENNELGVKDYPFSPHQRTSVLLGLRVGVFFADVIGVEGEIGVIPTVVKGTMGAALDYSSTDITYRAHLVAQLRARNPENKFIPFVFVGGGGFTVVQTNNEAQGDDPARVLTEDTDAAFYFGLGFKYRITPRMGLRLDGRLLLVPSSENADPPDPPDPDIKKVTTDFEALASFYLSFGDSKTVVIKEEPPEDDDPDKDGIRGSADQCPTDPEDKDAFQDDDGCSEPDNDGDGLLDAADKCPTDAEDKDAFQDDDGCPDPDNDGDGINDQQDKCPAEPEDKDQFQDDDGCPDLDNDGDGVLDAQDKCIDKPETKNGYQDEDGCPDEIPEKIRKFTGAIQGINFRVNSDALLATSNKTLDKAVAVLKEFPDLKLEIQGHTDDQPLKAKKGAKFADNLELSQGRAESVRAYFVKKGIDESRLSAKGFGDSNPVVPIEGLKGAKLTTARSKNRRVEFQLVSGLGATTAPAAAPATGGGAKLN
jgi:outer membrane protein OmpA-like peptidoglycan-associated protein/outer membrane protein W